MSRWLKIYGKQIRIWLEVVGKSLLLLAQVVRALS